MKPSEVLQGLLDDFRDAMVQKFVNRHEVAIRRHGSSVIDPDFDWDKLSLEHIEAHLREEMSEWLEDDGENRLIEDVDLANLAFLDWVARRRAIALAEQGEAEG